MSEAGPVSSSPASAQLGARRSPTLEVGALVQDDALEVRLELVAGEAGRKRVITNARIQKSGLALVGHFHGIVPTRVQLLGQTEIAFLGGLDGSARRTALQGFFGLGLSCVVLTHAMGCGRGDDCRAELIEVAEQTGTPLLQSSHRSSATINALHALLDDRLAPRVRLHGVLVDVFGVGLLITGVSGIGKSESALDLVMRGHRLVADDVVECDYRPPGMVFGTAAQLLRHHLEVRGLGILNVKDLFGVTSIRERKRIDAVVRLVEWSRDLEVDRLGLDDCFQEILGVSVPELVVPVRPGRDMATILEVAARNELLKNAGHHAAREFFGHLKVAAAGASGEGQPRPGPSLRVPNPPESSASGLRGGRAGRSPASEGGGTP